MIYFYASATTWMICEAHANFKALTAGIVSGRVKVYMPFGYGTPVAIIGVLFLMYADELGTDPRCFISWVQEPKVIFFLYIICLAFIGIVFSVIILFNIAKPQTKRKHLVANLTSQSRGTAFVCFALFLFWIFGCYTYVRNPESDAPDTYCIFIMFLGWFGAFIVFVGYGLMSKRFRNGVRGEKAIQAKYLAPEENEPSTRCVCSWHYVFLYLQFGIEK